MSGVPQSSSQVSSSVSDNMARNFDVGNEADILKLLNFIRRGPFDAGTTNKLRDLVLDYVQTKDDGVLVAVLEAVQPQGVTLLRAGVQVGGTANEPQIETQTISPQTKNAKSFSGARPQPSFGAMPSAVVQNTNEVASPPKQEDATATPPAQPVQVKSVQDEEVPQPSAPEPVQEPAPEVPPTPAPQPEPQAQSVAPTPQQTPAPSPVPQATATTATPLDRIKEIKADINAAVGNPVNLIDVNNQLGREYMNALLDAMKTVNGGTTEEVAFSMQRLEKAYGEVKTSIDNGSLDLSAAQTVAPVTTPEPAVNAASTAEAPQSTPTPSTPPTAPSTPPPQTPAPAPIPSVPQTPEPQEMVTPKAVAPTPQATQAFAPQSLAAKLQQEAANRAEIAAKSSAENDAKQQAEKNDPLHTEEINAGLQQLLSEWKLFKSSGIFGTGPSGYEHPLYKSIAPLPMAAVIAGRFEGATPEIKQSIADYMNGWRYEQSVVHEMNESFEHYLRRVIEQIIQKQNAISGAQTK